MTGQSVWHWQHRAETQTQAHCQSEEWEKPSSAISHKMTLRNAKCQKFPMKPWENLQTRCLTPLWQIINTEHMDPSTECSWKQSPLCLRPCRVSEDMDAVSEKTYTLVIQVFGQATMEIQKRFICELVYSSINYSISFLCLLPKLLQWPLVLFNIVSSLLWPNLLI